MNLSVPIAQKLFYFFMVAATYLGFQKEQQVSPKQSSQIQSQEMAVTMKCPVNVTVMCTFDEPAHVTSLSQFFSAGGTISTTCANGIDSTSFTIQSQLLAIKCPKRTDFTFSIKDSCSTMSTCTYRIVVSDNIAPTTFCPDVFLKCGMDEIPPIATSFSQYYSNLINNGGYLSDNCGLDTSSWVFVSDEIVPNQNCLYTVKRIYSVKDSCQGKVECENKFILIDNTNPEFITLRDTVLYLDSNCQADTSTGNLGYITGVSDNCGVRDTSINQIVKPGCSGGVDTLLRIWSVSDFCSNMKIDTQVIVLIDTIKPQISGPNDTTILCVYNTPPINTILIQTSDNCTSTPVVMFVKDSISDSMCLGKKTIWRIYKSTDNCNNSSRFIQKIVINDTIGPLLICPIDTQVLCISDIPIVDPAGISANDLCQGAVHVIHVKDSVADSSCINGKNLFRIYQANDTCNNIGHCIQKITIKDTVPPLTTCPSNETWECFTGVPDPDINSVTIDDECGGGMVIFVKDSTSDSTCINKRTINRIYLATDLCGNTARCIQLITVDDQDGPDMECPDQVDIACFANMPAPDSTLVTANDNCGTVTVHFDGDFISAICQNQLFIIRTYKAVDACLNENTCTQIISVMDTMAPVLIGNSNTAIYDCPAIFTIEIPTAMDNCDQIISVDTQKDSIPGSCPGSYQLIYTFSATDVCLNAAIRIDTITVKDDTPPDISCPMDKMIPCEGKPYQSLDSFLLDGGLVYDACGLDSTSFRFIRETITVENNLLNIKRVYAISDLCGNTDSCTQMLTSPMCFTDLALKALINAGDPYIIKPGGEVPACVIIYNQGFIPVDSIKVIAYLPTFTSIISPGWIKANDSTYCRYITQANGLLPAGGLLTGDTVKLSLKLKVSPDINTSIEIAVFEINEARDLLGNLLIDIDSTPDNIKDNDTGGVPLSSDDNKIDGDSRLNEDEDDQDPILYYVEHDLTCIAGASVTTAVDLNCMGCVLARDVLKGILLPEELYEITIYDAFGRPLSGNCIGREYLGQTLTYKVRVPLTNPNNNCWGKIKLEDKTPPALDCSNDTIYCVALNGLPPLPDVYDNCSGKASVVVLSEEWFDYGCDSGDIKGLFVRRIKAQDIWGNVSECSKKYFIRKIKLSDVVCPPDFSADCINGFYTDPSRTGAPSVNGIGLWPNNVSCNNFVFYKDDTLKACGAGFKIHRNWVIADHCTHLEIKCTQLIAIEDKTAPIITSINRQVFLPSDPHDCYGVFYLNEVGVFDCSITSQTYSFTYFEPEQPGKAKVITGTLPAKIYVPIGVNHKIYVDVSDACNHYKRDSIMVTVTDQTAPTPVCHETTRITLDPAKCWAQITAKDLDNGSHDNCCNTLHYAAAFMDDIEKARNDFKAKIMADCGDKEYWNNKAWYDSYIEEWINCFVFKDTLDASLCGTRQVVMRVYEACDIPRYDNHEFPCTPHAWYSYNSSWMYRVLFNYNFRSAATASKDCNFKAPWKCKDSTLIYLNQYNNYIIPYYRAQSLNKACYPIFYDAPTPSQFACVRKPLYADCMVSVILDDKTPPTCDKLNDITIYCDSVPFNISAHAWDICPGSGDSYPGVNGWPGDISFKGYNTIFGYYGGSFVMSHDDHLTVLPACDYDVSKNWAPVYCRTWLELDRYDSNEKLDPYKMFSNPVIVDRHHEKKAIKSNEFYVSDNCLIHAVTSKDEALLDQCGTGWIQRTWTITDSCGNKTTCIQKIIIKHRSDFEVIFPADKELDCSSAFASPDFTGRPIVSDDDCEQIAIHFDDDTFNIEVEACFKILRKWTIVDACQFDPNQHTFNPDIIVDDKLRANGTDRYCEFRNIKDNGDGYMTYTQIIKIIDTLPPVLACKDTTVCINGDGCSISVNLPIKASDNCSDDLWYDISIDQNNDGSFESVRKQVKTLSGTFSTGNYKVKVDAYDHCKNKSTSTFMLYIKDCKKPTPYCLNGVATVIMPSNGQLEIWASDLNKGSYDNCSTPDKLMFTFDNAGLHKSRILTCQDLPTGKTSIISVNMWVIDEAGNRDFCATYIQLEDNGTTQNPGGACKDTTILGNIVNLKGEIADESREPIENAIIKVTSNGYGLPEFKTNTSGSYTFYSIPSKVKVSIAPERNDDPMNGVSTIDLLLIERHIKGVVKLDSPYKMIAADVNRDNEISILDLIELRKLILGIYDNFTNSDSWRFVPKSFAFTDVNDPWNYPMQEHINAMSADTKIDFTGIKIGDVNNTSIPHSLMGTEIRQTTGGLELDIADRSVLKGQTITVNISSKNFNEIEGFQGTLTFDGFEYLGVERAAIDFDENHLGQRWLKNHMLTFSWHNTKAQTVASDKTLFKLRFKALKDQTLSQSLVISSYQTRSESYLLQGDEIAPLSLRFTDNNGRQVNQSELYQNYPNPFNDYSIIGLKLSQAGQGSLTIYDLNGRVIKRINKNWSAGYQEVRLNKSEINTSGILMYKFESQFFTASRKLTLIE